MPPTPTDSFSNILDSTKTKDLSQTLFLATPFLALNIALKCEFESGLLDSTSKQSEMLWSPSNDMWASAIDLVAGK